MVLLLSTSINVFSGWLVERLMTPISEVGKGVSLSGVRIPYYLLRTFMKKIILLTAILLTGCTSLNSILPNDRTACLEAQKSISRDQTMRDIAMLEMAKTANDQTKMAAMTAIAQSKSRDIDCK